MIKKRVSSKSKPIPKYWVWYPQGPERGKAFVTEMGGFSSEQHLRMLRGESLSPIPKVMIKDVTPGRFLDHLGNYLGILLVSPVLRRVLEESSGAHLQFIPVGVHGKSDLKYFGVNVLDSVPALDLKRSKVTRLPGASGIDRILSFAVRPIPEGAPPIFHVAEDTTLIVVNDELRLRLIAASKHPGVLTPAEKYRNEF
ncbi:MAG: hypothetical protein P0120_23715 [Nitrospira sp.]|nr:hypothetical protein [Nitrospira sp.]